MPQGTAAESDGNYPVPEEVLLNARVKEVAERRTPFEYKAHHKAVQNGRAKIGEKGEVVRWRWVFQLTDTEYQGLTVDGETDPKISTAEGDRARLWYETILDTQIQVGDNFNTDLLHGVPCVITVRHGEPRQKKTGGLFYPCEVEDVFPAGSKTNVDENPPF